MEFDDDAFEMDCFQEIDSYTVLKPVKKKGKVVYESKLIKSGSANEKPKNKKENKKLKNQKTIEVQAVTDKKDSSSLTENLDEPIKTKKRGRSTENNETKEIPQASKKQKIDKNDSEVLVKDNKKKKLKLKKQSIQNENKTTTSNVKNSCDNKIKKDNVNNQEAWRSLFVEETILKSIGKLGFTNPTEIQKQTIPAAICSNRDIVGAAETGSGKTLAFAIPIVQGILRNIQEESDAGGDDKENSKLRALIVTPTRELAAQVKKHVDAILSSTTIKSVLVIGGMFKGKQERLLKRSPEIVIGTPGRLWELIDEGNEHLQLNTVDYLAIDETDRMVEDGHFEDLHKILEIINGECYSPRRQTFVFSATLTLKRELPTNLKYKRKVNDVTGQSKLNEVLAMIGIKEKPKVVDLTTSMKTATNLTEAKLFCNTDTKEYYMFYLLKKFPGRTLVFCNSINCIRRLQKLFEMLQCNPQTIHASKYQKQRMKSLERFSKHDSGLLLATDVAARGLDLPEVKYVIHYEVPKSVKTYIHRSGRAGRAQHKGMSIMLVQPNEHTLYRNLMKHLEREKGLPDLPIQLIEADSFRDVVTLAKTIEQKEYKLHKSDINKDAVHKLANSAGLTEKENKYDQEDLMIVNRKSLKEKNKLENEKANLKALLKKGCRTFKYDGFSSISTLMTEKKGDASELLKKNIPVKIATMAIKDDKPKQRSAYSLKAARIRKYQYGKK